MWTGSKHINTFLTPLIARAMKIQIIMRYCSIVIRIDEFKMTENAKCQLVIRAHERERYKSINLNLIFIVNKIWKLPGI